ncbi:uncharacterized protein [Elaeis guineensis]|uniref:uncharacterized protein isoform X3 n=1 Tax=Elaeis guineensis var. tenera TaxID=51953 RepID=UPI003C6D0824
MAVLAVAGPSRRTRRRRRERSSSGIASASPSSPLPTPRRRNSTWRSWSPWWRASPIWLSSTLLARDVELFAQHAGRKSVNMEDIILSAHRNKHLTGLLRSFSQELKGKEPQTERKRKKSSKKEDKSIPR